MTDNGNTAVLYDSRMAKALINPLRARVLSILDERPASPSRIADELGLPVANVAYHVKILHQLDCIEQIEARPVRGAIEHVYRGKRRLVVEPEQWKVLPTTARHALGVKFAQVTQRDLMAALQGEAFEQRPDPHLTHTPLILDERGWENVRAILVDTLDRVLAEETAAAQRMSESHADEPRIRTRVTLMQYGAQ